MNFLISTNIIRTSSLKNYNFIILHTCLCLILLTLSLISCNDYKETVIPPEIESWETDNKFKKSVKKLNEEDKKLFVAYTMRAELGEVFGGKGIGKGLTIGQAIDIQKEWGEEQELEKQKQQLLAEELQKKQLSALKEMNSALTVSLISLKFNKSDWNSGTYSDYFSIEIAFKNNTDKNIMGAKGVVVLKDVFGDAIKNVRLSNDKDIKSNSTNSWYGTLDYNQFMAEDNKLRTTEFNKLKFEWIPDIYLFDDGSKLQMPNQN